MMRLSAAFTRRWLTTAFTAPITTGATEAAAAAGFEFVIGPVTTGAADFTEGGSNAGDGSAAPGACFGVL